MNIPGFKAVFKGSAGAGAGAVAGTSTGLLPPSNPRKGDTWVDLNTCIKYTYLFDGDSSAWVELGPVAATGAFDPSGPYNEILVPRTLPEGGEWHLFRSIKISESFTLNGTLVIGR